jgi:hypothetical protein
VDIEKLVEHMAKIKDVLGSFVIALCIAGAAIWFVVDRYYSGIVANKDSVIESKNAQIEQLKTKRENPESKITSAMGPIGSNSRIEVGPGTRIVGPLMVRADSGQYVFTVASGGTYSWPR